MAVLPPVTLTRSDFLDMDRLAEALAVRLEPGDVILLDGPVGMGKTYFVKAVARVLGSEDEVTSPTYALAQVYKGREVDILHVDAYRLSGVGEYLDMGMEAYFDEAMVFVEWGETVRGAHDDPLTLRIAQAPSGPEARSVTLEWEAGPWDNKVAALLADLGQGGAV
ncbi:tRNA (adenosine(37)-N6)-threonylcarbamoyltransferase complex ATPase subunit type 1 TsaE [Rhodospirillum sp. A1_3_36]|uniref:tRNA (adenosine(37)-N6)-threonylcarbamoyltransferase complex ATPase subunit type 1 TsaE n=1 Tax=Rhodospirillum sp. A1_3_36 TaxID=3391666 RepID=UPI0039A5B995